VNPTGSFELGGPHADCGLTGRKIIVYTYGGMARHGGGAFSGKDPTKVDRSAAYAVRQIAKSVVAAGLAKRCEAQVAYAIGVAHPVSIMVETFGTSEISSDKLEAMVREVFDMRPAAIIERLDLRRPIFKRTAAYGHFGRVEGDGFTWQHVSPYADELGRSAARGRRVERMDRVALVGPAGRRPAVGIGAESRAADGPALSSRPRCGAIGADAGRAPAAAPRSARAGGGPVCRIGIDDRLR